MRFLYYFSLCTLLYQVQAAFNLTLLGRRSIDTFLLFFTSINLIQVLPSTSLPTLTFTSKNRKTDIHSHLRKELRYPLPCTARMEVYISSSFNFHFMFKKQEKRYPSKKFRYPLQGWRYPLPYIETSISCLFSLKIVTLPQKSKSKKVKKGYYHFYPQKNAKRDIHSSGHVHSKWISVEVSLRSLFIKNRVFFA